MLNEMFQRILEWPLIIQGALGSALFWLLLQIFSYLIKFTARQLGIFKFRTKRERKLREYIYHKYTNSDGLFYFAQGYFLSFKLALEFILQGILFFLMGFLLSFIYETYLIVGIIGAIYYIIRALSWTMPYDRDVFSSGIERWKKIADLENDLWGEPKKDTLEFIEKFKQEKNKRQNEANIDDEK